MDEDTVPPLAAEVWRLEMQTPQRQLINPFLRQFHDAVLQGGVMPVEMVRARLTGQPLSRDHRSGWRFAGNPLEP